jgi:RNA polymerase sigma-70 factor (ECF subfamily)
MSYAMTRLPATTTERTTSVSTAMTARLANRQAGTSLEQNEKSLDATREPSIGYDAGSDAALVHRAARGDVTAFRELVERYQRPMAALISRMTDNPDDVDDILQELFIRAWKGLPRFRGDAQFSTWLYRIAVNTTIKHRSRHRAEAAMSVSADALTGGLDALLGPEHTPPAPSLDGDPYQAAQRKEREMLVRRAVQALPEKQRTVVVLHYFDGHSCEEISKIVGCTLGTVWSRLHYACKRLKGVLDAPEE